MTTQKCGEFIASLRKEKKLTQKELADKLNVTDKAISRWETGKGYPDVESLQNLSAFFGVSINELLAGEKAEIKSIEEIAEENILTAIIECEKNKKTKKTTIILSIIVALILIIPLLKGSIESIVELLWKYTLVKEPWLIIFNLFFSQGEYLLKTIAVFLQTLQETHKKLMVREYFLLVSFYRAERCNTLCVSNPNDIDFCFLIAHTASLPFLTL